uniref:DEP domain-containing protein n=1 Tax=Romanomermis culicivorax TaxID=13658 RepID=A0A915HYR3_ROMCU
MRADKKPVFEGRRLVDWLLEKEICQNRSTALLYCQCLCRGKILSRLITEVDIFCDNDFKYQCLLDKRRKILI